MNRKLQAIAHYVIFRRDPGELGRTKLAKILLLADIMMYRSHGRTISGQVSAEKRQHGPIPWEFFDVLDDLKRQGKILERRTQTPLAPRIEYLWVKEPDLQAFTGEEVAIIEDAAEWISKNFTASGISEATHDALWDETPLGEEIPMEALATYPGEITPEIMAWASD